MGPGAEGRRRRSNAPGAKPPAASELAQIERPDHVERGARADLEFGGGHGGGHEGFCEDQVRKRRQTRIPPLAAAAPFEARPGGRETITFGEPPSAAALIAARVAARRASRPFSRRTSQGTARSPRLTQGRCTRALPRLRSRSATSSGPSQKSCSAGESSCQASYATAAARVGGRSAVDFDARTPLRKKRLFVVIGIVDQVMAGVVESAENRRRSVGPSASSRDDRAITASIAKNSAANGSSS